MIVRSITTLSPPLQTPYPSTCLVIIHLQRSPRARITKSPLRRRWGTSRGSRRWTPGPGPWGRWMSPGQNRTQGSPARTGTTSSTCRLSTLEACRRPSSSSQVCEERYIKTQDSYFFSVSVSKSVTNVKPEVLASGRILTHMTPIPSTLT